MLREELVEDDPKAVNVGPWPYLAVPAGKLLGGHIGRRADSQIVLRNIGFETGDTKIRYPCLPTTIDDDVCRLKITVQNSRVMNGSEPDAQFTRYLDRPL